MGILQSWNDFAHRIKLPKELDQIRGNVSHKKRPMFTVMDDPEGSESMSVKVPAGISVQDLIAAARARIEFDQDGAFPCDENAEAIYHLTRALVELEKRRIRCAEAQTESTHEGN